MKHIYIILTIIATSILFSSCEKVITLELEDSNIKTVVEAQVNNGEGNNYVILSKSGSFYEPNTFPMVKNADVQITDQDGNNFTLTEVEDGVYNHPLLDGNMLKQYQLRITAEGKTITSSSIMPELVSIDSLVVEISEEDEPGGGEVKYSTTYCHFQDPPGIKNFYKFRVSVTGLEEKEKGNVSTFIFNDDFISGKSARIGLPGGFPGETVTVQLFSIDKANYEYYRILEENGMSMFSTSIGNPTSNVDGEDVIGVFGANAVDQKSIIVEDPK